MHQRCCVRAKAVYTIAKNWIAPFPSLSSEPTMTLRDFENGYEYCGGATIRPNMT
jgi:hypothetical protein